VDAPEQAAAPCRQMCRRVHRFHFSSATQVRWG
jgi:hypothetical protein